MVDTVLIITILLLIVAIVGAFTPVLPGAILSTVAVLFYWWANNYSELSVWFVALSVILGIISLLIDWFSGAISAKAGGASTETTKAAAIAGIFGFIFLGGPIGVIIAVSGTVFIREYFKTGNARDARKAAIYAALGFIASAGMQALIAITILIGFILAVLI